MRIDFVPDPCLPNALKYAMVRMTVTVEATKISKRVDPVRTVVVIEVVRGHTFLSTSIVVDQRRLYDERAGREHSQQDPTGNDAHRAKQKVLSPSTPPPHPRSRGSRW